MIHNLLLAVALLTADPSFEVQTTEGQAVAGQLVDLSGGSITLQTAQGRTKLPLDSLIAVVRQGAEQPSPRKPTLWVELVDQTGLPATSFTTKGDKAQIEGTRAGNLELPTEAIRWVRFTPPGDRNEKLTRQWNEIVDTKAAGDVLVLRKNEALDFLEGIVNELDLETCKFQLDKQPPAAVKRPRIEGIVFYHKKAAERVESLGLATADDGSKLPIRQIELSGGNAKITTPAGQSFTWPLEEIKRIDFSSGKITYLSDLDPESEAYVPFLQFKDELAAVRDFYHFRRDVGFDQTALRLDGRAYRKGLAVQSRTTLAYRLPEKLRLFKAVVGIEEAVRASGHVQVEIRGDGKVLWQAEVAGHDPAREIEVDIRGVKRLEVFVDFGDGQDVGDRLVLADARLMK